MRQRFARLVPKLPLNMLLESCSHTARRCTLRLSAVFKRTSADVPCASNKPH